MDELLNAELGGTTETKGTEATSSLSTDSISEIIGDSMLSPLMETQIAEKTNNGVELSPMNKLTAEEQEKAKAIAHSLVSSDSTNLVTFGAQAQQSLGTFSQEIVGRANSKDLGEVGDVLTHLMVELKTTDPDGLKQKGLLARLFGQAKATVYETTVKYQKASTTVKGIEKELEIRKQGLVSDHQYLEKMYQKNLEHFQALNILIAAGEEKLKDIDSKELPALTAKARQSNDQMDAQAVKDLSDYRGRLEKRITDLALTREITVQQAPQIRMIQKTNIDLAEKIQSSIATAIPLWHNQIALAMAISRQEGTVRAQRIVTDTTNELLKKNAEMLKMSTISSAKETERGLIDIETLKKTQADLISTIEQTIQIQREGAERRDQAKLELVNMENDLKTKLLEAVATDEPKKELY